MKSKRTVIYSTLEYLAIGIYYYAFRALSDLNDEVSFLSLKQLLIGKIHVFTHREQRDIYILTINYCIKKLNTGAEHFIREAFETYQRGLEKAYSLKIEFYLDGPIIVLLSLV
ncbi:MAG: hypothetical protein ACI94Y_003696 [Maribacter sp.]|jgi:hypothetical protein